MAGGLFDPLGTDRLSDRPAATATLSAPLAVAVLALAGMAALIALAYLRDDGDRGQPTAISTIDHVASPPKPAVAPPAASPPSPPGASTQATVDPATMTGLTPLRDDQEVEVQNGVRIIRPRRAHPEGQAGKSSAAAVPSSPTAAH